MKLRSIICGLLAIAATVGCEEEIPFEPKLSVNRSAAEIGAEGGDVLVEVTSNASWSAETDADWITAITPSQGKADEKPVSVTVTVAANEATEAREATVTFKAGTVSKTTKITQTGKTDQSGNDDEVTGTDSDLYAVWAFSTDIKSANEATWHQSSNDTEEGASDRHLESTFGEGDITYHQVSKSGFPTNKIRRHTGKSGEPMAYGAWIGDHYIFEVDHALQANSNVSMAFGIWGSGKALKYWMLEYKDGDQWLPAGPVESLGDIRYNVVCGSEETPTIINEMVVIKTAGDKVQFRLQCVSAVRCDGVEATEPADNSYIRIRPENHIIIKGSAITEEDLAAVIAPALAVDKTEISAEAAGKTETIALTSNIAWTAESSADWVSVLPPSGEASETATEVTVTVEENATIEPRSATLKFTGTYGKATIIKTVAVSQTGKEPEPVVGTDSDLFVAWAFSDALNALHKETFHQNQTNDKAPGDGGKYISPALGTGKFSYVQIDKSNLAGGKIYRHIHDSNYPMVYGVWPGDYFLFEAETANPLPANSNVSISFHTYASNDATLKYWMLEYKDGDEWKQALPGKLENDVNYNVAILNKAENTLHVNAAAILTNSTSKISFRLRCVSNISIKGEELKAAPESAIRIDSGYPVIIKGSAITDEDIASVIAPAISLSKETAAAEAAAGEVKTSVTSNMAWTAASDSDWATVSPASAEASETASELTVTVAANTSDQERTATITVTGTYGNVSIPKTFTVTQAGNTEEEPEPEPVQSLNVMWEWTANQGADQTADEKALYEKNQTSWHQADSDTAAGDGGRYISSTSGNGKLTYVQTDKSSYTSTIRRHLGKNAEPVVYGAWEGDYFLFEAADGQTYPAGTKVSISFDLASNSSGNKPWRLDYLDGTTWKTAKESIEFISGTISVSETITTTSANSQFSFRLICTGKVKVGDGSDLTKPSGNQRISSSAPVVIKVVE